MRSLRPLLLLASATAAVTGCGDGEPSRPAPAPIAGVGPSIEVEECEAPPVVDTEGSCGSETVSLQAKPPTIYFVLDTSGSMSEAVLDGRDTKIEAARAALSTVVEEVGHRIKFGLAAFPADDDDDDDDIDPENPPLLGCAAGEQVFPITAGDPIECVNLAPNGPVLRDFRSTLSRLNAVGGTPLSPTMKSLSPTLLGQEGNTAVVLVTDGSPNCNPDAACGPEDCGPNRAGASLQDVRCDEDFNCCDPDLVQDYLAYPGAGCVDVDESEASLADLRDGGINTYVIGVLGEENFDDVMNRLAVAGGKPREGERSYYDVESLAELTATVRAIGADLSQSCEIVLEERPLFADELNVYFDAELIPSDPDNGWTLSEDEETVTLHGDVCEQITAGLVDEVQLLSGCRTIVL